MKKSEQIKREIESLELAEKVITEKRASMRLVYKSSLMEEAVEVIKVDMATCGVEIPTMEQLDAASFEYHTNSPLMYSEVTRDEFRKFIQSKIACTINVTL